MKTTLIIVAASLFIGGLAFAALNFGTAAPAMVALALVSGAVTYKALDIISAWLKSRFGLTMCEVEMHQYGDMWRPRSHSR